jgi:hypothetical protein
LQLKATTRARIKEINTTLILSHAVRVHDPVVSTVLPLYFQERTDRMSETQQFKNFRIWAAVGVALVYVILAVSGNA